MKVQKYDLKKVVITKIIIQKKMKTIGILGYGWLGKHIADFFSKKEYNVVASTTSVSKISTIREKNYIPVLIEFSDNHLDSFESNNSVHQCDILVICVPFSINIDEKALLNRFSNLCRFIGNYQKQVFLMSSTGIYPQKNIVMDEENLPDIALNQSFLNIERMMQKAFGQINILRLAGLTGGTRKFSNYKVSEPELPVNQIHYTDICLILDKMVALNINSKTYNVVAPLHPSKQEIIDFQEHSINPVQVYADIPRRIINGAKLEKELNYQYNYPNPVYFP